MKNQGMAFGSKGPEGGDKQASAANELGGAKGGGMKHVVSPGADGGSPMGGGMEDQKKHMMMIALLRAMQGGQGGAPPMGGGQPMGQPPMPMGGMQQ
jgi:hypothetical protein